MKSDTVVLLFFIFTLWVLVLFQHRSIHLETVRTRLIVEEVLGVVDSLQVKVDNPPWWR